MDGRESGGALESDIYAKCNISPRDSFHGGSVMVWGVISREARTELVVFVRGTLTAVRYVKKFVSQHVVVFAGFIDQNS